MFGFRITFGSFLSSGQKEGDRIEPYDLFTDTTARYQPSSLSAVS